MIEKIITAAAKIRNESLLIAIFHLISRRRRRRRQPLHLHVQLHHHQALY